MNRFFSFRKKVFFSTLILSQIALSVFSQAIISKASEKINNNLIIGEYDKAYDAARFILKFYGSDEIPFEYLTNVKKAVKAQSEQLVSKQDWIGLQQLNEDLSLAPEEIKEAIKPALEKYNGVKEEQELERRKKQAEDDTLIQQIKNAENNSQKGSGTEAAANGNIQVIQNQQTADGTVPSQIIIQNDNSTLEKILESFEKSRKEDYELRLKQEKERLEYERRNQQSIENLVQIMKDGQAYPSKNNNLVIFILVAVFIVIFIIITFLIVLVVRSQKIQNQQLNAAMETMQAMRTISASTQALQLTLEGPQGAGSINQLLIGNNAQTDSSNEEVQEIQKLIEACKQYGNQIDKATNRNEVSKKVAELALKISVEMGHTQIDSMLHYAAAFVYDIGFLSIDNSILCSEVLTKEQFDILKTHTDAGINMVFFVPEKYRNLFKDAVSKHHENIDGSGYPNHLKSTEIPYIARLLRVVESFIALISRRSYRDSLEKEEAFNELRNNECQYDQDIVEALIKVV